MFGLDKKLRKGEYGYIAQYKKVYGLLSLGWVIVIAAFLIIGLCVYKTRLNVVTVLAVLAVLPAARKWLAWIMMLPYQGASKDQYDAAATLVNGKHGKLMADHVITKYEGAMYLPLVYCYNDNFFVWAPAQKKTKLQITKYLNEILAAGGSSSKAQVYETYETWFASIQKLSEGRDQIGQHQADIEKQLMIVTM